MISEKVTDGVLASGGALFATGVEAVSDTANNFNNVIEAVGNASGGDIMTVIVVGVLVPFVKDILYKGAKWLIAKVFKKSNV
jgi:hypothetical protein